LEQFPGSTTKILKEVHTGLYDHITNTLKTVLSPLQSIPHFTKSKILPIIRKDVWITCKS
jgi:hypothetical protein